MIIMIMYDIIEYRTFSSPSFWHQSTSFITFSNMIVAIFFILVCYFQPHFSHYKNFPHCKHWFPNVFAILLNATLLFCSCGTSQRSIESFLLLVYFYPFQKPFRNISNHTPFSRRAFQCFLLAFPMPFRAYSKHFQGICESLLHFQNLLLAFSIPFMIFSLPFWGLFKARTQLFFLLRFIDQNRGSTVMLLALLCSASSMIK